MSLTRVVESMQYQAVDCLANEPVTEPGPLVIARMAADKLGGPAKCYYALPVTERVEKPSKAIEPAKIEVETKDTEPGQGELF